MSCNEIIFIIIIIGCSPISEFFLFLYNDIDKSGNFQIITNPVFISLKVTDDEVLKTLHVHDISQY